MDFRAWTGPDRYRLSKFGKAALGPDSLPYQVRHLVFRVGKGEDDVRWQAIVVGMGDRWK